MFTGLITTRALLPRTEEAPVASGTLVDLRRCALVTVLYAIAASVVLAPQRSQAQALRVREHPRWLEERSDGGDVRSVGDALPDPLLYEGSQVGFPAVDGPLRLRGDRRGEIPSQPISIADLRARFFPGWSGVLVPEVRSLTTSSPRFETEFRPEAGVCYALLAWNVALADFRERQDAAGGRLSWWESGADIDAQVRGLESDHLIAEDLTREAYPRVRWCSDGAPVRVMVRIARPDEAPSEVRFAWTIVRDDSTVEPQRYAGETPLGRRLNWARSVVAPRSEQLSSPSIVRFARPGLVRVEVDRPGWGCDWLIAVGDATVEALALSIRDDSRTRGDYRGESLVAVPLCADAGSSSAATLVLAVRSGFGAVAIARYRVP